MTQGDCAKIAEHFCNTPFGGYLLRCHPMKMKSRPFQNLSTVWILMLASVLIKGKAYFSFFVNISGIYDFVLFLRNHQDSISNAGVKSPENLNWVPYLKKFPLSNYSIQKEDTPWLFQYSLVFTWYPFWVYGIN